MRSWKNVLLNSKENRDDIEATAVEPLMISLERAGIVVLILTIIALLTCRLYDIKLINRKYMNMMELYPDFKDFFSF